MSHHPRAVEMRAIDAESFVSDHAEQVSAEDLQEAVYVLGFAGAFLDNSAAYRVADALQRVLRAR